MYALDTARTSDSIRFLDETRCISSRRVSDTGAQPDVYLNLPYNRPVVVTSFKVADASVYIENTSVSVIATEPPDLEWRNSRCLIWLSKLIITLNTLENVSKKSTPW